MKKKDHVSALLERWQRLIGQHPEQQVTRQIRLQEASRDGKLLFGPFTLSKQRVLVATLILGAILTSFYLINLIFIFTRG